MHDIQTQLIPLHFYSISSLLARVFHNLILSDCISAALSRIKSGVRIGPAKILEDSMAPCGPTTTLNGHNVLCAVKKLLALCVTLGSRSPELYLDACR